MDETIKSAEDLLVRFFVEYGFRILGAGLIVLAGLLIARWVGRLLARQLAKLSLEMPTQVLLGRLVRLLILGLAVVIAVQKLGVEITPLVAGLGVVGVGIGLAMQGVLGNAVAGLNIIFSKPYRIGEYIEISGEEGKVCSIEIFSTTLVHGDLSRVVIPNRKIVGEILHNYGKNRRLELNVGVAYTSDLDAVLTTIRQVLASNSRVLKDPAPVVGVESLSESSIDISVKPWVGLDDYVAARGEICLAIVAAFRERGISIPFPQREIRLLEPRPALPDVAELLGRQTGQPPGR